MFLYEGNKNMGYNLAGQVFGTFTAIRRDNSGGMLGTSWECVCICTKEQSFQTKWLLECRAKRNGPRCPACYPQRGPSYIPVKHFSNIAGLILCNLTVLSRANNDKRGNAMWIVIC